MRDRIGRPILVIAGLDMGAGVFHELQVEMQVVDGRKRPAERFFCLEEVAQVGAAVVAAAVAVAFGIEREVVAVGEFRALVAEHSPAGVNEAVLGVFRGQDAVEHVHATLHKFEQVPRSADTHHVAGAVLGQIVCAKVRNFVHDFDGFAHGESAHRVAVGRKFLERLDGFLAEFLVHAALDNPEKVLRVAVNRRIFAEPVHGASGPLEREIQRMGGFLDGARVRRAFVEGHDDIRADFALGLHHRFGRKLVAAAVEQALEFHAVFGNAAEILEAPHLETAAVGEHGAVPAHELLHAARLGDQGRSRPKVEVVGVREDDLRLDVPEVADREPLHAGQCPDRHKDRRLDVAMGRTDTPAAGLAARRFRQEFEGVAVHGRKSRKSEPAEGAIPVALQRRRTPLAAHNVEAVLPFGGNRGRRDRTAFPQGRLRGIRDRRVGGSIGGRLFDDLPDKVVRLPLRILHHGISHGLQVESALVVLEAERVRRVHHRIVQKVLLVRTAVVAVSRSPNARRGRFVRDIHDALPELDAVGHRVLPHRENLHESGRVGAVHEFEGVVGRDPHAILGTAEGLDPPLHKERFLEDVLVHGVHDFSVIDEVLFALDLARVIETVRPEVLTVAVEFRIGAVDFFKERLRPFALEDAAFHHRLVFRGRAHAHGMGHFVHGGAHEHVAAFLAEPQIAVAAGFGGRYPGRIVHVDVLGKVRVLVVEVNGGIHDRGDAPVGVQFVFRRVAGLVEDVFDGRRGIRRKACD